MMKVYANIDEYISDHPANKQKLLKQLRQVIAKAAPDATEKISYGMPCFYRYANLVYFAAMKNHIGFYPTSSGVAAFSDMLGEYVTSKGAIQFPLDQPLPLSLIKDIVKFRLAEEETRAMAKRQLKTCRSGHQYYKSSDCPVCPECEKAKKPVNDWKAALSAPARRALEAAGINTEKQLAKTTEAAVMALHGMGKASLPILQTALKNKGLSFKKGSKS